MSHPTWWHNVRQAAPVSHFHCYPHSPSQLAPLTQLACTTVLEKAFLWATIKPPRKLQDCTRMMGHLHCTASFSVGFIPSRRMHFLCRSVRVSRCIDFGPLSNMQLSVPNSETSIFPLLSTSQRLKTACPSASSLGSKVPESKRIQKISWTKMTTFTLPLWVKVTAWAACMACPVSSELATMPWFQYGQPRKLDVQS